MSRRLLPASVREQQLACNYISNAQCWRIILQKWRHLRSKMEVMACCSSLHFLSFFLWFWKPALEKKKPIVMLVLSSVGFLFPCPPLCVPFLVLLYCPLSFTVSLSLYVLGSVIPLLWPENGLSSHVRASRS